MIGMDIMKSASGNSHEIMLKRENKDVNGSDSLD